MPEISQEELRRLVKKYRSELKSELVIPAVTPAKPVSSREYQQFKKDYMPKHITLFERLCNLSERILKIKPDEKKARELQDQIDTCHLNMTPAGAQSLAFLGPILIGMLGALVSLLLMKSVFFAFLFVMLAIILYFPFSKLTEFFANTWRLKTSNQMVLCIFYVVTYMRHTSNLELGINFAAEHLGPPMSLDLRKVLWDVETERYESVKESLDYYLKRWKRYNMEFVESFHLIESSLYEPAENRRVAALDKALDVILDGTYEKMLHYAHNLKSPITTLHMMGIILPILGLVILPLVVSFISSVKWYHLAMLYNVLLPVIVYYMGKGILAKRPTGYGDTDITEQNPGLRKYKNVLVSIGKTQIQINPFWFAAMVGIMLFLIAIMPLALFAIDPDVDSPLNKLGFGSHREDAPAPFLLLGYRISQETGEVVGPYGLGATIIGLFFPLSIGLSLGLYYKLRSKNVIKIRENAKKLEQEFASALFQLGNRMGDGLPAEIAFGKVAEVMEGTTSGNFFSLVSTNIRKLGMSVRQAIFNPKVGALIYYPSAVISSSMKVLVESAKKGPLIASKAIMSVSLYLKEIHRVNERLIDLMADIIQSMKSQINFLAPVISGIVIGITTMVTTIIGKLGDLLETQRAELGPDAAGGTVPTGFMEMFGDGVPPYFFQIIVGVYVVQIIYILTILANGIENGPDVLSERYNLGINLIKSTILYIFVALFITIAFNLIAMRILETTIGF